MQLPDFQRTNTYTLKSRLLEGSPFIQVVLGPRQVGKTTAVLQVLQSWKGPTVYASADAPSPPGPDWIEQAWRSAELKSSQNEHTLVVLDEIQKVHGWAEIIKAFWDEAKYSSKCIRLVLCGSSSLQLHSGLTESLAGRFEVVRMPHWSFSEMKECFNWDLSWYLYYGGYPGAAWLAGDWRRWADYVQQSLVETVLGKDIMLLHRIQKPALLRQLYALACDYAGYIVSYQKMLGQLQDAGNTTTLASYQQLLEGAYLLQGLQKWSGAKVRTRASSPKWLPRNTALVTSQSGLSTEEWMEDARAWGRLVEIAVGAHAVNMGDEKGVSVFYWRERNQEVDFVLKKGRKLVALEVKSGVYATRPSGLKAFQKVWPEAKTWLIGSGGIPVEEFLKSDLEALF